MSKSLDEMSDAEIDQLYSQATNKQQKSLEEMSDTEIDNLYNQAQQQAVDSQIEPGMLESAGRFALEKAAQLGSAIDQYTGAPVRASIGAAQRGENPLVAYASQFGEDPSLAPTGAEIARVAGISDKPIYDKALLFGETGPSPADIVGLGVDVVADPLTVVPIGTVLKGAGKVAMGGTKLGAKVADFGLGTTARLIDTALPINRAAETTYQGAKQVGKSTVKNLDAAKDFIKNNFTPKPVPEFEELSQIASKYNINPENLPEATKYGQGSFASRAARVQAEGVLGEPRLKKFEQVTRETSNAFDEQLRVLSGVDPKNLSPVKIGEEIKDQYLRTIDSTLKDADTTYRTVANKLGQGAEMPSVIAKKFSDKITRIEEQAKSLMRSGSKASEAQASEILKNVKKLKSLKSLDEQVTFMQTIGKEAYDKSSILQGQLKADTKSKRKIYEALREGITDSFRVFEGDEIADTLIENNKKLSEMFSDENLIGKQIKSAQSGEEVFKGLIERGTSKEIDALTKYIPEETIKKAKASYLNSVATRNNDGLVIFENLPKKLERKSLQIGNLFSEDELLPFGEISRLGATYGKPIMSTSGTGASSSLMSIFKSIPDAIANEKVLESITGSKSSIKGMDALDVGGKRAKPVTREVLNQLNKRNIRTKTAQTTSVQERERRKKALLKD